MNQEIQLKLPILRNSYPKVVQDTRTVKTNPMVNLSQMGDRLSSDSKKDFKFNINTEHSIIHNRHDVSNTVGNEVTMVFTLTPQNVHQSIRNIHDRKFIDKATLYQNRLYDNTQNRTISQSQASLDQMIKELDDFRNYKLYENIEHKDYSLTSYKLDDKKAKSIKEKYQKHQQFVDKINHDYDNQFNYMQNNINLQQLLCLEIFRQLEIMPNAQNSLFQKHYEYELSNMKIIQQLIKEQIDLKQENEDLKRQLEYGNQQNMENMQQIKSYSSNYDEMVQKDFQNKFKNIKDQILFENQRLKKEIQILNEIVKQIDQEEILQNTTRQINQIKKECQKEINMYKVKLKNADGVYMIQKNILNNTKIKLNKQVTEYQQLRNENQILRMKVKDYEANFNADDFTIFRETVQIQQEDLFLKEELILNLKEQLNKIYDEHLKLQSKYDNLIQQEQKIVVDKEKFIDQQDLLKELRLNISEDLRLQKGIYSQFSNPNKDQIVKNLNLLQQMGNEIYEDKKVQYQSGNVNQHNDNQRNRYQLYRLYKPSFSYFMNSAMKQVKLDDIVEKVDYNPKWLMFVKIRAILDSKFNEILANNINNDQCINISKFPEFVYGWISNFTIDLNTREIASLDLRETKIEDIRTEFLFELMLQKYSRLWEIVNFKNFLSEKYELDDLYFYLSIRYLVFNGPQLSISKSKFDYIHFIDEDKIREITVQVLKKHSFEQKEFVINKVKDKGCTKGKKFMVDVQFLLSVFLEYYRSEKKIKCKIIRDLFLSFQNIGASKEYSVSFDDFMTIMDQNFGTLSLTEKVSVYRECWNVGGGNIGPEVFMAVCQEKNLFIRQMNIANLINFPIELDSDSSIYPKNEATFLHYEAYQTIQKNIPFFKNVESQIESLGMEQFLSDFLQCQSIITTKFQKSSFEIRDKSVFQIMFRLLNKILQLQNIQQLNRIQVQNAPEMPIIQLISSFINQIVDLNKEQHKESTLLKVSNNLKLIKFQIFSRKQILKFYGNLYKILNKDINRKKRAKPTHLSQQP